MSTRDERADYLNAYIAEYESYKAVGLDERAEAVAEVLRTGFGHEVDPRPPVKETAVGQALLETAVEQDVPPRKPGRPRKPHPEEPAGA